MYLVGILLTLLPLLVLRSTICAEIVEALMKEDDIHIAYPTQQININKTSNAYGPSRAMPREEIEDIEDIIAKRQDDF